jgi:NTP pyrophosphatase (non-canonical NTP hydrolase)
MIDNAKLAAALRRFAEERDWEQFHTPKNLATSVVVESAELLELFQWSRGQSGWDEMAEPNLKARAEEELADVLIYILRFADLAKIDLEAAVIRKIEQNAEKYPAEKSRGSDKKYNEH